MNSYMIPVQVVVVLRLVLVGASTVVLTGTIGGVSAGEVMNHTSSSNKTPPAASSPKTVPQTNTSSLVVVDSGGDGTVLPPSITGGFRRTEPLTCWTCSSNTHGGDCYDLDHDNLTFTSSASSNCSLDEAFCTVRRIWYVIEGGLEEMNFSVNRTCAATCDPSCMVIGDRTKIYQCISCCSEPLCNTGSSAGATHYSSTPLLKAALLAALTPTVTSALLLH